MTDIDPQTIDQMREAVGTMSDDEVNAFVVASPGGPQGVLGQVFDGMRAAFNPEKAAGQDVAVQWDIRTPDATVSYALRVAGGAFDVSEGEADTPRVTFKVALPDFLRLMLGSLDGMQAFMSGKLQVTGDIFFAQQFQTLFDRP